MGTSRFATLTISPGFRGWRGLARGSGMVSATAAAAVFSVFLIEETSSAGAGSEAAFGFSAGLGGGSACDVPL